MSEQSLPEEDGREALRRERQRFRKAVERQGERRRRSRRTGDRGLWFGLSSFGMVGWSIAVPTLLGVALGLWLDARFDGGTRYTLSLLIAGLAVGIANVWRWIQMQAAEADADVVVEPDPPEPDALGPGESEPDVSELHFSEPDGEAARRERENGRGKAGREAGIREGAGRSDGP